MTWQRCVSHPPHYIHIADTPSLLGVVLISVSAKIGVKGHFSLSSPSSSYLTPPRVTIPMSGGEHKGWRSRTLPIRSINKPKRMFGNGGKYVYGWLGSRPVKRADLFCYVWPQNAILSFHTCLNIICYLVAILSVITISGAVNVGCCFKSFRDLFCFEETRSIQIFFAKAKTIWWKLRSS